MEQAKLEAAVEAALARAAAVPSLFLAPLKGAIVGRWVRYGGGRAGSMSSARRHEYWFSPEGTFTFQIESSDMAVPLGLVPGAFASSSTGDRGVYLVTGASEVFIASQGGRCEYVAASVKDSELTLNGVVYGRS